MTQFTIGTKVLVTLYGDLGELPGEIMDGPIQKDGRLVVKIQHSDFENWYPVERVKPFLSIVPDT
ncbi:hypothetical protein QEZ52_00270 [Aliisedimentitalea scapharcae]|uniref:Uncharacterized protein n=1 Tax=Aliisedimentitalea scapharcae TaxID=1524259 RepID=A0ABZ2XSF0_9RHOB